jgi:hypothetical protein
MVSKVLTTKEMVARGAVISKNRSRYAIGISDCLEIEDIQLPVDPYVMGFWLADGHKYSANVSINNRDREEILAQFAKTGYSVEVKYEKENHCEGKVCFKGETIFPRLRELDLINKSGDVKPIRIPNQYLFSSESDRRRLLKGIMDGDGTSSPKTRWVNITSVSKGFAGDMCVLLSSLGFKPKFKLHANIDGKDYWNVGFTCYDMKEVFTVSSKMRFKGGLPTRVTESKYRRIRSIEPAGKRLVKCIAVDSPSHLYLCTKSLIPTHNTELILNTVGYYIHQDPSPILVMQPTVELAEAWSKDRFAPMLRDSPALKDKISDKSRDGSNKVLHKQFDGGQITMVGANSPGNLKKATLLN